MKEFFNGLISYPPLEVANGEHDEAIEAAAAVLRYAIECLEAQQRKPGHAGIFEDTINGLKDEIGNLPPQSPSWVEMQEMAALVARNGR